MFGITHPVLDSNLEARVQRSIPEHESSAAKLRRVLIVCPRFAPVNAVDMHRVRQSVRYFEEFGWTPTILAVRPEACDHPVEPQLELTIPEGTRIIRVGAVPPKLLGFNDFGLRALPYVALAGDRLLRQERFDAVYFSTTAFSLTALGPYWLRRHRVPYVLDWQDPWLTDYYRNSGVKPPGGQLKYSISQLLARLLEPATMRYTSHVITVSPSYPDELQRRYPRLAGRFTVLPFGALEADFTVLEHSLVNQSVFDPSDGNEHWVYAGAAGPMMEFALSGFFSALKRARVSCPRRYARVRVHFVGTNYAAPGVAYKTVEPIAEQCGVGDMVEESPARIPYFEALRCLRDADALVVPGSDDPGYAPSKLFPYILARKPLLGIVHEQCSAAGFLRDTRAGTVVTFGEHDSVDALATAIGDAWFRSPILHKPNTDWDAFEPFTARQMTKRQSAVLDLVAAARA